MFFKKALKTITGVKIEDDQLEDDLKHINETKLEAIDEGQIDFFSRIRYNDYKDWRAFTLETYQARAAVKKALENARGTTDKNLWYQAYDLAKEADAETKQLLSFKLYQFTSLFSFNPIKLPMLTALKTSLVYFLSKNISRNYELTEIQGQNLFSLLFALVFSIELYSMLMEINYYRVLLEPFLVESDWCAHVLAEAQQVGIEINPNRVKKSNAQLLADIGCENSPRKFHCIITREVMTHPVYCASDGPLGTRFEKDTLKKWLKIKAINPLTQKPLKWENIIPDEDLGKEIAIYTREMVEMASEDKLSKLVSRPYR